MIIFYFAWPDGFDLAEQPGLASHQASKSHWLLESQAVCLSFSFISHQQQQSKNWRWVHMNSLNLQKKITFL